MRGQDREQEYVQLHTQTIKHAPGKVVGQAMVPGSCGELVQGVVDGIDFHITCPVEMFSSAFVSETKTGSIQVKHDHSEKVVRAIDEFVERYVAENIADNGRLNGRYPGYGSSNQGLLVELINALPVGKGMASSTTDIGSAVAAISRYLNVDLRASDVAEIALKIEPTDGVLFDGIVLFDHVTGNRLETIGSAPLLEIIVLEPPNRIDTVAFNKDKIKDKTVNESVKERSAAVNEAIFRETIEMVREGLAAFDHTLIGQAGTLSARLNQTLLFKPELDDIIEMSQRRGALGVNVAHSGTVFGIILEAGIGHSFLERISHYVPKNWNAFVTKMIDGGIRYVEDC
jgi:L-threonine kinase